MKRILPLLLITVLLFSLALPALADKAVVITRQPKNTTVHAGGNASFSAEADNDNGITWRLVSPDGSQEILVKDVGTVFPGVTYSGRNGDTLTLKNVPAEMNGWGVYCTYSNATGKYPTKMAYLYIEGASAVFIPTGNDAGGEIAGYNGNEGFDDNDALSYAAAAEGRLLLTVRGATLTADGYVGNQVDFTKAGQISFKVNADVTPAYWVINGARYDFDQVPTVISVRDLNYSMTIEAVPRGAASETRLNAEALQAKRTGAPLIATSKSADLCFINAAGQGKGGWFREFDFTNDYQNLATNQTEQGGSITLRCRAYVAPDHKITAWEFNKVRLTFSSYVTEFIVSGLNETMEYHPLTEAVPVYYNITCDGCTFTGGGYTNATSGTVPAGTSVTFNTKWLRVMYWNINGSTLTRKGQMQVDEGYWDDREELWVEVLVWKDADVNVADDSITRTINKDTTVKCQAVIY